jgi:hypothetical protein
MPVIRNIALSNRTQANPDLTVDTAVERKTLKPPAGPSFGQMMGTAADVALSGVEIGATVVGGPLVGAAVRGVRTGVAGALPTGPLSGAPGGTPSSTGEIAAQSGSQEQSTMNEVRDMQEQSQSFNLQFLALQEEVQQENRKFTTVSNVLKAKHETAKGAIGNIRS